MEAPTLRAMVMETLAMLRLRGYRDGDEEAVLALWERAGIARPWLDLRTEIREKRRRDRSLFVVAATTAA